MKKNEQGVTMIQMVIAIVMLVLSAGFSIYNARNTIIETKVAKVYNEMVQVKKAVVDLEILSSDGIENIGTVIENFNSPSYNQLLPYYSANQEYYLLDFKTNGAIVCEELEIRNIENNYIVNVNDIENI